MTYDASLAGIYDLIYALGGMKDYAAEANVIAGLIRDRHPAATSILDVACGTGLHLHTFAGLFDHVEGVDLSPDMAAIAVDRNPAITIHIGDMQTLRLGRTFSAVTCLFSSIGYLPSQAALQQSLAVFAQHTEPGGVVLIEPWFTPQQWKPNNVHQTNAEAEGRHLVRMAYSTSLDTQSIMEMHYLYGQPEQGIRYWTDQHRMSLFTTTQYEDAFAAAGFVQVHWLPGWRTGRDRIIGTLPKSTER